MNFAVVRARLKPRHYTIAVLAGLQVVRARLKPRHYTIAVVAGLQARRF